MHNSNLIYNHTVQLMKICQKTIYVSLAACLGPTQEMGMNFKHIIVLARSQTSGNLILNSCKCKPRQKFMKFGGAINCPVVCVVVQKLPNFGQVLAQSLLQIKPKVITKKVVCADRESSHFMCETTSVVFSHLEFISGVTIEQHMTVMINCVFFPGFVRPI